MRIAIIACSGSSGINPFPFHGFVVYGPGRWGGGRATHNPPGLEVPQKDLDMNSCWLLGAISREEGKRLKVG